MTVETAFVPAGPYARATNGSTGIAPSAVTSCPDARRIVAPPVAKVVSRMPARGEVTPHCILPRSVRRGLDHPPEQAPAHVRVRPELARRHACADVRNEPRERTVVLVLSAGEVELQPGAAAAAQSDSQEGPAGSRLEPSRLPRSSGTCAATGSSSDNRPACARRAITVATIDLVNDPTLKRVSGVTGSPVLTSATPNRRSWPCSAEDPDCRAGHRMPRSVLTKQSRQIALVHPENRNGSVSEALPR